MFKPKRLIFAVTLAAGLLLSSPVNAEVHKEVHGNTTTTVSTSYSAKLKNVGAQQLVTKKKCPVVFGREWVTQL